MQLLVIKLNTLDSTPEYALLGNKQAEDRFTPIDWKKVRSLTRGRRVLLLIPDDEVVLTSIKIPSKNKKQLLQAVPFALEDTLAEDIEDLHFAIHQDKQGAETQVSIINRLQLNAYLGLLRKNGITVHFALPQVLALTIKKNAWSIQQQNTDDKTSVSVRLNDYYGFSCNQSLLMQFLEQLEESTPPELIYSNIDKSQLPIALQNYPLEQTDSNVIHHNSVINALPLNLIAGFVSQKGESSINWKAWRPTLVMGSIIAAIWIGIFSWQNSLLTKESKQLTQSINNVFTSTFPNKEHNGNAINRMQSELTILKRGAGQTISSPLPLISGISPLLKEYNDMTLSEVQYKENKLSLVIQSPSLTRLETFKKDAAEKMKLDVNIKSSTTTSNKVEAILIISPLTETTAITHVDNARGKA